MTQQQPEHETAPPIAASATVEELTADHRGRWRVQTAGSVHIFDLDRSTHVRHRGTSRAGFAHDGRVLRVTSWVRWPKVGGSFFIWLDDPDVPELVEHWRQSSEVVSIIQLGPDEEM